MADDRAKALITARQEEDATGRLAELEEQFVQKLDESDRYKQEAEALKQVVSCFKQACDAKGITPDFPAALAPLVQRLYADQGASGSGGAAGGAAADGALPKDGDSVPHPHPTPPDRRLTVHVPRRSFWAGLTPEQQAAARALGWHSAAMWDDGVSPASGTKAWGQLTSKQRKAATTLGWAKASWEAEAVQ